MIALVLVMANEVAIPLDFLARPILLSLLPAGLIGLLVSPLRRVRLLTAIALSILVLIPELWVLIIGLGSLEFVIWLVRRRATTAGIAVGRFAVISMLVIAVVSGIRLAPQIGDYAASAAASTTPTGVPVYLILLDGYPRLDSLNELGIDNSAFIGDLEERGFEHYPEATSAHQWTHRTLQALVAGSPAGIPDEPGSSQVEQAIRSSLQLPAAYLAIDPPASHVVMRGGANASAGGMNDFEIRLVGSSILGAVAPNWAAPLIADSLREHFERSLELMTETDSTRVFTHVLAPHPPFIYADGISACWPGCNIFDVSAENLEIDREEWSAQMAVQLEAVNDRVLAAVDRLLAKHPQAVIVLFSDHGGRYDAASNEVHHSFLVAKTPGHAGMFDREPHPHAVLRLVTDAYR